MSDDTISRQAVLNLLIRCAVPENGGSLLYQGIKQLPSTELRGQWQKNKQYVFVCSVCGCEAYCDEFGEQKLSTYCPDCGSLMVGVKK